MVVRRILLPRTRQFVVGGLGLGRRRSSGQQRPRRASGHPASRPQGTRRDTSAPHGTPAIYFLFFLLPGGGIIWWAGTGAPGAVQKRKARSSPRLHYYYYSTYGAASGQEGSPKPGAGATSRSRRGR